MRIEVDDGVGLEVREQGAGPALLLVHGFGGAKEDFADHLDALAVGHRVVTFDHRGHGESDHPGDPSAYSIDRMAADVVAVAGALGIDRFRLLGHSLGGMIARRVVLRWPGLVEAVILMDTSSGCPDGIERSMAETAAFLAREQGMAALREAMLAADPLVTPAHARLIAERPGYEEFGITKWFAQSPVMYAAMVMDIVDQPDQLADLAAVTCPALVIAGEQDEPFLRQSRAMAETIPGAQLAIIADAGHSPQFENPPAWLAVLTTFLASLEARV
jgi:pimeloyl-ACP methyl ester carboxylesterase